MPTYLWREMHYPIFCHLNFGDYLNDELPTPIMCLFLILKQLKVRAESLNAKFSVEVLNNSKFERFLERSSILKYGNIFGFKSDLLTVRYFDSTTKMYESEDEYY